MLSCALSTSAAEAAAFLIVRVSLPTSDGQQLTKSYYSNRLTTNLF